MRYDVPIYFQQLVQGKYDVKTGDYAEDYVSETMRYAGVMDTRTETMRLVYGGIRQGSLTAHIQNHYAENFDRIRVGEKIYTVDFSRKLRTKQSFVLSEVQKNG